MVGERSCLTSLIQEEKYPCNNYVVHFLASEPGAWNCMYHHIFQCISVTFNPEKCFKFSICHLYRGQEIKVTLTHVHEPEIWVQIILQKIRRAHTVQIIMCKFCMCVNNYVLLVTI